MSFLDHEDKIPVMLTLSLFKTPIDALGGYRTFSSNNHWRVWRNESKYIIGILSTARFHDIKRWCENRRQQYTFIGYGDGGKLAMDLCINVFKSSAISLNGTTDGTVYHGNIKHYHIHGDMNSAYILGNVEKRRIKLYGTKFNEIFYDVFNKHINWTFSSPNEEDRDLQKWAEFKWKTNPIELYHEIFNCLKRKSIARLPIPESERWVIV